MCLLDVSMRTCLAIAVFTIALHLQHLQATLEQEPAYGGGWEQGRAGGGEDSDSESADSAAAVQDLLRQAEAAHAGLSS